MNSGDSQRVVVLGASDNPERYSNKAIRMLKEHHHEVVPVHPALEKIEGLEVSASLGDVVSEPGTLTLYVNSQISAGLADDIVGLKPGRVIFNPGTESAALAEQLDAAGIRHLEACTLVLLSTGQF